MTNTNRRNAIRMAAGAVALGAAPAAALTPDPIFALIQRHRAAVATLDAECTVQARLERELPRSARQTGWRGVEEAENGRGRLHIVETDAPRWIAFCQAWDKASNDADDIAIEMLVNTPTTLAGLASLLRYAADFMAEGAEWPVVESADFPSSWGASWETVLLVKAAEALEKMGSA